jgi:hypothetical protein
MSRATQWDASVEQSAALSMLDQPDAGIQRYRAPDSLFDFLETL